MPYLPVVARFLLGLIFVIMGSNKFLNFISMPSPPESARLLLSALSQTGYFFQFQGSLEVTIGVLLITRFYVPLSLVMIFPLAIQIFLFHFFLDHNGLPLAVIVLGLDLYLGWIYRRSYQGLLQSRVDYLN